MSDAEAAFEEGFTGKSMPAPSLEDADIEAARQKAGEKYPALAPHLAEAVVQKGDPNVYYKTGGHLEFYSPWESENPNPGKVTLEIYNHGLKGAALEDAIAGDMLHHLGSVNPETGEPVDAKWRAMRDEVIAARSPQSKAMDERAYANAVTSGDTRDLNTWMDYSRADAHVRGYITPDKENNWRDAYTPEQKAKLEEMKAHLATRGTVQ